MEKEKVPFILSFSTHTWVKGTEDLILSVLREHGPSPAFSFVWAQRISYTELMPRPWANVVASRLHLEGQ